MFSNTYLTITRRNVLFLFCANNAFTLHLTLDGWSQSLSVECVSQYVSAGCGYCSSTCSPNKIAFFPLTVLLANFTRSGIRGIKELSEEKRRWKSVLKERKTEKKERNRPQTLLLFPLQAAIFRQSSIKSAAFPYCQPLVKPKRPCQLRALGRQAGRQEGRKEGRQAGRMQHSTLSLRIVGIGGGAGSGL